MHVPMASHRSDLVAIVTQLMKRQKLPCTDVSVRMVAPVPPMMPVTWFVDVDRTLKELIVMNTFQEVGSIPTPIQVPLYQPSLSSSVSFSVLVCIYSSKRNNCKYNLENLAHQLNLSRSESNLDLPIQASLSEVEQTSSLMAVALVVIKA